MSAAVAATINATADREIVVSRVINAPRELVFDAFTDPRHISEWWGPRGFTTTTEHIDVRAGGTWKHVMRGPDGVDYPNFIVYKEVVRPERLAYSHGSAEGEPADFEVTVTFAAEGSQTKVTLRSLFPSAEARDYVVREYGALEGAKQTLERFEEVVARVLAADVEFVITRTFDAPREAVFKAFTEAEQLAQWWGPKGMKITVAKLELRPGGMFLYSMEAAKGTWMWGKFVYREISAPDRLVFVNSFSDEQGNTLRAPFAENFPLEVLNTWTFTEQNGKTTLTGRGVPINATETERTAYADMHKSMTQGFGATLDQLAAYLGQRAA